MNKWKDVLASRNLLPETTTSSAKKRARAASISPTKRSLAYLRSKGYVCAVVEHWNAHAGIRQDLFGVIDILALGEGTSADRGIILGVQTTSGSNVSARITKIRESPYYDRLIDCGIRLVVHGWEKKGARGKPKMMTLREEFV